MTSKDNKKPSLAGQRIRSRKRDEKAKFEPEAFRDDLVLGLKEAGDLEKAAKFLDGASGDLDYRRYAEPLFDVLLAGGLLAPGGDVEGSEEEDQISPICVFSARDETEIKEYAQLFVKVIRRFKYLQVSLEAEIAKVLKFIRAFNGEQWNKLAKFTAQLLSLALISAKPLESLLLDSLVKDGLSLSFVTVMLQAWVAEAGIASLVSTLKKSQLENRLLEFFPTTNRTAEKMTQHFEEAGGLEDLVKWQASQQAGDQKRQIQRDIVQMLTEEADVAAIIEKVKENLESSELTEAEGIPYVWVGIMDVVDWNKKADMAAEFSLRHVKNNIRIIKAFTKSQESQINLLVKMQTYCYENQQFMNIFQKLVLLLYKADAIGEDAIFDWFSKSHSPKGKTVFLEQMQKMIDWLKNAEEESSEEDD